MTPQSESESGGDATDKLLKPPASPASGWTTGFAALASAGMEDKWVFQEDTYTLGVLAVVEKGVRAAWLHLIVALLTPTIQFGCFFKIFENLISEAWNPDDMPEACNLLYVRLICFFLMALQVSNEALEAFQKIVFSLRALTGVYVDVKGTPGAGIFLGFLQFGMSFGTVGLSMLVVSQQTTALDAFMNFVALAFLTEVDNILMSSRTVQNFVQVEKTEIIAAIKPTAFEGAEKRPWTPRLMCCANVMMVSPMTIGCAVVWLTAQRSEDPENLHAFMECLPSALLLWAALNLIMWFGSQRFGAVDCSVCVALVCGVLDLVDKVHLYTTYRRLFSPPVLLVPLWFQYAASVTAVAAQKDPASLLSCPFRIPLLVWLMLGQSVFFFDSLHRFGSD